MSLSWGVSWLRSWGGSWGSSNPLTQTTGGISYEDAKRYREYLERLVNINQPKQVNELVIEAAEAVKELPVKTKQLKAIVQKQEINFKALDREIQAILAYLDKMEKQALIIQNRIRKQQDDDLALLLLLS